VEFGLSPTPEEYSEFILGEFDPMVVSVPAGVAHSYKILSGECDIIYAATATYETSRNDEGRIEYNRWPEHEWWREVEIR
jgi:dTDP-4-dehydrorhamnose 3,5-epimerase-like enzyme